MSSQVKIPARRHQTVGYLAGIAKGGSGSAARFAPDRCRCLPNARNGSVAAGHFKVLPSTDLAPMRIRRAAADGRRSVQDDWNRQLCRQSGATSVTG